VEEGRASRLPRVVSHSDCSSPDLIIDAVYEGGQTKDTGSDAISKVMPGSGNRGGFRAAGTGDDKKFVVLYTSGEDGDWPDDLDLNTGQFVYFGDNKTPGHELHDTGRARSRSRSPARQEVRRQVRCVALSHLRDRYCLDSGYDAALRRMK
jgi:hypothetical protein